MRQLIFWGFALLALPACSSFEAAGTSSPPPPSSTTPDPGTIPTFGVDPRSGLVICEIEIPNARRCPANDDEITRGIPLDEAALALNEGRSALYALDYSAAAQGVCGAGKPQLVYFLHDFPAGTPVCANCSATGVLGPPPMKYPQANSLCIERCLDSFPGNVPHCFSAARAATNAFAPPALSTGCFVNLCAETGTTVLVIDDPRRNAEPVVWQDAHGVQGTGAEFNNLTRTAETTGEWDAGAVSAQWIRRGDGYVEFTAARNHQLGLTEIDAATCPYPCTDTNYGLSGISYGLDIGADRLVNIFKKGVKVDGVGTSNDGDRFRIYVKSNPDGTARIRFVRVEGTCIDGKTCNLTQLGAEITGAKWPLRVDASIQDKGTTIGNVRMVYIH